MIGTPIVFRSVLLAIFVASSLGFAGPSENESTSVEERLMLGWVDFWNSKDITQLDRLYLRDAVYEDVPEGVEYNGLAAIRQSLSEDIAYAPDVRVEVISILVSHNRGVVEWIWSGTQTGDISGLIEATGKKFSIRGVSVFEFENDRIKKQSDYYDAGTFLHQLGVKFIFPTTKE